MMNTHRYQQPLRSNFDAVKRCWVYHKERGESRRKDTLPSPQATRLRMEIAMFKADLARPEWIQNRIATLETKLGLRVSNP
jgi:hypothetical protein